MTASLVSAVVVNSHGSVVGIVLGLAIIWVVLLDAFETVVLPRRVRRHFKLTAWFYRQTWIPWRNLARHIKTASRQQNFLGYFGPLSLILLLGFWAAGLIFGFGFWAAGLKLGIALSALGSVLEHLTRYDEATKVLEEAVRLQSTPPAEPADLVESLTYLSD